MSVFLRSLSSGQSSLTWNKDLGQIEWIWISTFRGYTEGPFSWALNTFFECPISFQNARISRQNKKLTFNWPQMRAENIFRPVLFQNFIGLSLHQKKTCMESTNDFQQHVIYVSKIKVKRHWVFFIAFKTPLTKLPPRVSSKKL